MELTFLNLPLGETASIMTTKTLREMHLNLTDALARTIFKLPVNWDLENTAYDKTLKTEHNVFAFMEQSIFQEQIATDYYS